MMETKILSFWESISNCSILGAARNEGEKQLKAEQVTREDFVYLLGNFPLAEYHPSSLVALHAEFATALLEQTSF